MNREDLISMLNFTAAEYTAKAEEYDLCGFEEFIDQIIEMTEDECGNTMDAVFIAEDAYRGL